jgi:hypothetical protein
MNIVHAYRVAKVLADLGHTESALIPHADMDMAAILADVPRPTTPADRAEICETLDALPTP